METGLHRPVHLLAPADQPWVDLHQVHRLEPPGLVEHITDGHTLPECQPPSKTDLDTEG